MNPLAALFFAVNEHHEKEGEIFVMDAQRLLPDRPNPDDWEFPQSIVSMRHPFARDAIGRCFWDESKKREAITLPIRPDNTLGRIAQQSSCFTLHMHRSPQRNNPTLLRFTIPAERKPFILQVLWQLNINEFTIFNDLDHLAKEIRRTRRLRK